MNEEALSSSPSWVLRLVITSLVVAVAYLHLSEREKRNEQHQSNATATAMSPEEQQEARRKRLKHLEEQQQQQREDENTTNKNGSRASTLTQTATSTSTSATPSSTVPVSKSASSSTTTNKSVKEQPKTIQKQTEAKTQPPKKDTKKNASAGTSAKANASTKRISISKATSSKSEAKSFETITKPTRSTTGNKDTPAETKPTRKDVPTPMQIDTTQDPMTAKKSTNNKTPKSSPKSKIPRDVLLQALSSITGLTTTAPGGLSYKPTKKTTSTKTSPSASTLSASIRLPNVPSKDASWKDLIKQCHQYGLLEPFQNYLRPSSSTTTTKKQQYGPTKLSDGKLWKASEWYNQSKTWIRESSSIKLEELAQSQLQECLDYFQQSIMTTILQEFQTDIVQQSLNMETDPTNKTNNDDDDDDDDDIDFGLFADESYGNPEALDILSTPAANNNKTTDGKDNNKTSLFQEFFQILEDPSCAKILTKPFLAQLIQSYDNVLSTQNPSQSSSSSSSSILAMVLLKESLKRLPSPETKSALEWDATQRQLTAISNLLTLSPDVVQALSQTILPVAAAAENNGGGAMPTDGVEWENRAMLRSLLSLGAFTVPRFSKTSTSGTMQRRPYDDLLPHAFHHAMCDAMGPEYPVCLYARQGYDSSITSYHATIKHARNIMKCARTTGALALRKIAASSNTSATGSEGNQSSLRKGGILFDWIAQILETNEPIVDMLQSDLLSPDTAQALCASRPFLLGITTSLLQMSTTNLTARLEKDGWEAFDYRYFVRDEESVSDNDKHPGKRHQRLGIAIAPKERCLVEQVVATNNKRKRSGTNDDLPSRFAGATEFFFLIAGLLRVSLFPGFRVDEEFQSMLRNVFAGIQQLATQQPTVEQLRSIRRDAMEQFQKCSSVVQGWMAFVDDPDTSPLITSFSLMQLRWVAMVASETSASAALAQIPEWFVKLPAQWLAHVAIYTSHLLQPHQGEAAVKYATQILQAGTQNTTSDLSTQSFSPPVLCQLIRIAGAFVREGVRRAKAREKNKAHHRGRHGGFKKNNSPNPEEDEDFELDIIDDRTLDIYHSFDARDLGVTVFTNEFVAKQLCPTIMRAYMAMDAVEGMDVEREYHFEKFEVKHEVADLLLRLWFHPNGQSRNSIVKDLDVVAMNEFISSIAGALGFQLDQSCQFILDIRDIRTTHEQQFRHMRELPPLPQRDEASIEHHARFISFSLFQCRRLLMILCSFSEESSIAASLGGANTRGIGRSAAPDLAAMFVNLIDRLTDEDGGIHPELEMQQLPPEKRSAELLRHLNSVDPTDLKGALQYLLRSRRFALLEYGLDVGLLVHQLLALAARWHLASATVGNGRRRRSTFLEAIVRNDLCNVKQLRNVFIRLAGAPREMSGSETDNAEYILKRDGHVDISNWKESHKITGTGPDKGRSRRNTAKQDRMSHSDLESLVDLKDIEKFLDDLELAVASKVTTAVAAKWGTDVMERLEASLLSQSICLKDDAYGECLQEWVVSSDSFLSKAGNGAFAHSYDSIVRGRSVEGIGSGKILVKEARKCQRLLPSPHPNTSVFVCFAEERTDLCKAIIIGAAETPFALGMFEFDILFPSNYPASPPLLNFKTTGDGRTRISSNLYNDGKVCISILGTYQAWDDSQRWNPSTSSLAQVLASIQTQLLGDAEPYFSDGFNHDSVRGTPAGDRGSQRFNNKIRLHTLRHGMIDHLKKPALGFDEVTKRHFAMCRRRVLAQARRWTMEARGTPLFKSFVKSYEELITLLSSKEILYHKLPGQADEDVSLWGAVSPDASDMKALAIVDPLFLKQHDKSLKACRPKEEEDSKPAAVLPVSSATTIVGGQEQAQSHDSNGNAPVALDTGYNPWATVAEDGAGVSPVAALVNNTSRPSDQELDDDDFDELYS